MDKITKVCAFVLLVCPIAIIVANAIMDYKAAQDAQNALDADKWKAQRAKESVGV